MTLTLTSPAFSEGSMIPKKYTCEAADVSPELKWSGAPAETQSFALIVDDPDAPAGTWTHWIAWNIPGNSTHLRESVPKNEALKDGSRQGRNDFKRIGYGGPCPPSGKPHRYFFRLFALGSKLDIASGATRRDLEAAIKGHVLAQAQLMGKYER